MQEFTFTMQVEEETLPEFLLRGQLVIQQMVWDQEPEADVGRLILVIRKDTETPVQKIQRQADENIEMLTDTYGVMNREA